MKKKNSEYIGVDDKYMPDDVYPRSGSYSSGPENEQYVQESVLGDREQTKKTVRKVAKGFGIGYAVFVGIVIIIMISMIVFAFNMFNKVSDSIDDFGDFGSSMPGSDILDDMDDHFDDVQLKQQTAVFNGPLEMYKGTNSAFFMESLLDNIVTANTKGDHIVVLAYNGKSVTDPADIVKIKRGMKDDCEYEVLFSYDANGFINKCDVSEYEAD